MAKLEFGADVFLMLAQDRRFLCREPATGENRPVCFVEKTEIFGSVAATQRVAANDRTVTAMTDDLVARAGRQRAHVKFVILAKSQSLVITQRMFVEKGAAYHRFQEAGFPALHTRPGNIPFHEFRQRQKPRLGLEAGRLHGGRAWNGLLDEGDIIGHEVPVVIGQHGGETAAEEKSSASRMLMRGAEDIEMA